MIAAPIRKRVNLGNLLVAFLFISLFFSLLLGHKNYHGFHSYSLFFPSLYKDLFDAGGSWKDWSLSPAPYYFPDMVGYFLVRSLIHDVFLSFLFSSIIQFLGLVSSFLYLYKGIYGKITDQVAVFTVFLASLVYYLNSVPNFPFFQFNFTIVSHTGAMISAVLCAGLVIRFIKTNSNHYLLFIFLLCFFTVLSDKLFVIMFVIPSLLSLAFLFCLNQLSRVALSYLGISISSSAFLGIKLAPFTHPYVARNSGLYISNDLTSSRLQRIFTSIEGLLRNIRDLQGQALYYFIFLILVSSVVFIAVLYYIYILTRTSGKDIQIAYRFFFFLLYLIAIPLNVFAVVFLGIYTHLAHYSNFITTVPLICFPFLLFNKEGLLYKGRHKNVFLSFVTLITLGILFFNTPLEKTKFEFYPAMTECLDGHKETYQLANGLSVYRDTRVNTMFSKTGIWINQISADGSPWHWLNSLQWYEDIKNYNFIILERLNKGEILKKYGEPSAAFNCNGVDVIVYNRNSNLEKVIHANGIISEIRFNKTGKFHAEARFLASNIGTTVGSDRVVKEGAGSGYLVFGPYLSLSKGSYKFSMKYSAKADTQPIASWDIGVFTSNEIKLKAGEIIVNHAENNVISAVVDVPQKLKFVEFRVYYHGKGDLTIHSMTIERVGIGNTPGLEF